MQPTAQTAILLFLRPAADEARCKRWQDNRQKNEALANCLIAHTKAAAAATGLPVIIRETAQQRGCSFGERMANAIEDVFHLGYAQVIALGTDTPDISTAAILKVAHRIRPGVLVTGPAPDGGIYTLGISQCDWNRADFLKIDWQTTGVQKGLAQCASSNKLSQTVLQPLSDLDNQKDLQNWLRSNPVSRQFLKIVRHILRTIPASHPVHLQLRPQAVRNGKGFCGPPVFAGS